MQLNKGVFAFGLAGVFAFGYSLVGAPPTSRTSTDPPLPATGKLGQDLFLAIDHHDAAQIKTLLSEGADPDSRNGLQFTPLYMAAASHQTDAMKMLLDAGAGKDVRTTYGTPLSFASISGNVEGAKLLLSMGVNADVPRTDGMTPLILAANVGATPIVTDLIEAKAKVNAQDEGGETALAHAARAGALDTAKALIDAGADVNLDDALGQTPLMHAALTGHAKVVSLLLKSGAHANATDNAGRTALTLTASYGDYPDVVHALIEGGANPKVRDGKGRSAGTLAAEHGYFATAAILHANRPERAPLPRTAIRRSLGILQASTRMFASEAKCVSCHQEGIGQITTGEAAARGFRLNPEVQAIEAERVGGMVKAMLPLHTQALKSPEAMKQLPLIEINEVSDTDGWILGGMLAQKQPPTKATAAMARVLARQQAPDGGWTISLPRIPLQSSEFTFTALAVQALKAYGPADHRAEMRQRIAKAKEWLLNAKPKTSEDRASRLLGLAWSNAGSGAKRAAVSAILADQNKDGGWSQDPASHSDAYATGQALYALRVGGAVSESNPAVRRGVRFLLRTQQPDGSWFVYKRAIPANNYFSTGFPYGESQYASFCGTCWATRALLLDLK